METLFLSLLGLAIFIVLVVFFRSMAATPSDRRVDISDKSAFLYGSIFFYTHAHNVSHDYYDLKKPKIRKMVQFLLSVRDNPSPEVKEWLRDVDQAIEGLREDCSNELGRWISIEMYDYPPQEEESEEKPHSWQPNCGGALLGLLMIGLSPVLPILLIPGLICLVGGFIGGESSNQADDSSWSGSDDDRGWETKSERDRRWREEDQEKEEKLEKFINEHGREPGPWENW